MLFFGLLVLILLLKIIQPLFPDYKSDHFYQFEDGMYVEFEEPQSAITEGQFVAWYLENELVGSGVIS